MLFSVLKKYSGKQFVTDVIAGLIVAVIALPLSIALALASGVGPEQGVYTAIVAGFIISFLGGSRVQIAGPTAAFATIVAGIVARNGMNRFYPALFGGIPATGAIARTAANIKNGGRTPIAGIVHAIVLVLVLVFLMPYAAMIPMPAIAAILFMVAYNMCQWRTFVHLCKTAPVGDILVLVLTFVLTVVFDLVVAIEAGMICACVLFMKKMSDETKISRWKYFDPEEYPDGIDYMEVPRHVRVFEISGPMFFGDADQLSGVNYKDFTKVIIMRMRGVPAIDATAMHSLEQLYERCKANDIRLVFSHVNEQPYKTMEKSGFVKKVGKDNFRPHIDDAIEWSKQFE